MIQHLYFRILYLRIKIQRLGFAVKRVEFSVWQRIRV